VADVPSGLSLTPQEKNYLGDLIISYISVKVFLRTEQEHFQHTLSQFRIPPFPGDHCTFVVAVSCSSGLSA
jgi:hypothetical protein